MSVVNCLSPTDYLKTVKPKKKTAKLTFYSDRNHFSVYLNKTYNYEPNRQE